MSEISIQADNIWKQYRIGQKARYRTFRDILAESAAAPFEWLASLARGRKIEKVAQDSIWALKELSFSVREGEILGIVGKNGAGKSTLLKILSRITEPTKGCVEMRGRIGSLLEVGTGFHPELTGRENIYLSGAILGMKKNEIERKFDAIVSFAEVEKFIDTAVKYYSSGMFVRLAFAVAAHLEPEILLIDEVLAVGDYNFQRKCLDKVDEIRKEGRTVLIVSHNLNSIASLCSRAILLHEGRMTFEGSPPEVIKTYIETTSSSSCEVLWNRPEAAPGSEKVRWHAVRVLSDERKPSYEHDIAKEIIFQLDYWCLEEGAVFTPAFQLWTKMGTDVLETNSADTVSLTPDEWNGRHHEIGLYRSECSIPGNFLNCGDYYISVGIMGIDESQVKEAISFHIYDTGAMKKGGTWLGVVRPRLAWKTELIEQ